MKKRIIALLMALVLLLCLPSIQAEGTYDGLIQDEPVIQDGPLTVESLIAACKEKDIAVKTELMLALHDFFLSEMAVSSAEMELDAAKKDMEKIKADQLMGLADATAAEAAQLKLDKAQGEYDKAQLEQLKVVAVIRGYTDMDVRGQGLKADDAYLTLQPGQIDLEELKTAASGLLSSEDNTEVVMLTMEQDYIDITIYYAEIGAAAAAYRTACAVQEETALAVVMGNADANALVNSAMSMKQARLTLFQVISDYSKLLYRVNEKCGGLLVEKAGKLTAVLGD